MLYFQVACAQKFQTKNDFFFVLLANMEYYQSVKILEEMIHSKYQHTTVEHSGGMNSRATPLKFVCPRITHAISIFPASQLHFLANRNPELAGGSQ